MNKLRVRFHYWHQYAWFYIWKWTMPYPSLHRRTIYYVNHARQGYLDAYRLLWPKEPSC